MNVPFSSLNIEIEPKCAELKINDALTLEVRTYLPIEEKSQFITFVINSALDSKTGCFSPLRLEVYFTLALAKFYAGINFEEELLSDAGKIYDALEKSGLTTMIRSKIPEDELCFLEDLVRDTAQDMARFNNSFIGTLMAMNGEASTLDEQLKTIIEGLRSKENIELISEIKEHLGSSN